MKPCLILLAALLAAPALQASIPDAVPYQGRIAANGTNYTGSGQFKFAIYQQTPGNPASAALLWTNAAGTATGAPAEPATAVSVPVSNGYYSLGMGDTAVSGMAALPPSLSPAAGQRAYVRVWFSTTGAAGSFQALAPDTELRSVPFAREAGSVAGIATANLPQLNAANTFTNVNGLTVTGTGPFNADPASTASIPVSAAGTRMEFIPGYSAFRAGTATGDQWAQANIGVYSTAFGKDTVAQGITSTAMGFASVAGGIDSTALGHVAVASGDYSTALGNSTKAAGPSSIAMGYATLASGTDSTAIGHQTIASSYAETALGMFNTPDDHDQLLVVGNGTDDSNRHDALVITKNACLAVAGTGPTFDSSRFLYTPAVDATVPVKGAGTRMEFLPGYSAFRVGTVTGDEWDPTNVGIYSTAMGLGTTASGLSATAVGYQASARGDFSTAMGRDTKAGAPYSTAMGSFTNASGSYSTAMGSYATASGNVSTAMGASTTASGDLSTAMGNLTTASGDLSTAAGLWVTARSFSETAIGCYNTDYTPANPSSWNNADRLFVVGNGTNGSNRHDALVMLKNGDTTFSGNVKALTLTPTSDRNRKTDIVPADTAAVLAGVAALPIATWKFKEETATHLGPMAQDFAAAFHLGSTDTGIATVDADGVALASIQELNKRVTALTEQNDALLEDSAAKDAKIASLEARLTAIEAKLTK